jgi:hypothetical protein
MPGCRPHGICALGQCDYFLSQVLSSFEDDMYEHTHIGWHHAQYGYLFRCVISKTQQRILTVLFGQPDHSFYANEIIAMADSGSGAAQRELALGSGV